MTSIKTTVNNPFGAINVTLETGDVIRMTTSVEVEIGSDNTMRAIVNGTPSPVGWQTIPQEAIASLAKNKIIFAGHNKEEV